MNADRGFFLARADACATEAATATLDNVRERALRSEAAWRAMAARQTLIAESRAMAEAEKRERREAEERNNVA